MKEKTRNLIRPAIPLVQPTKSKGRTFTRKSKGQLEREARRYQQHLTTGVLKLL